MPDKFPTSPSDGEQHTNSLGTIYQYLAVDNKWYIVTAITHNSLDGLNDGIDYEHISADQVSALHSVLTNLTQLGTRNHNDLLNIQGGANLQHLSSGQVSALHAFIDAYTKAEINAMDIHPESHNIVSHDTTATGPNLNTLVGGGETALHSHAGGGGGDIFHSGYIHLQDQKADGVHGGTFTKDAWRTRVLNTEVSDEPNACSLSSNQFTLLAGTYIISALAPSYKSSSTSLILYNITDSSTQLAGIPSSIGPAIDVVTCTFVNGQFTIGEQKTFEIRSWCNSTTATQGFGWAQAYDGAIEVYCDVQLWKVT